MLQIRRTHKLEAKIYSWSAFCLLMPIWVDLGSKHPGNTIYSWAIAHLHRTILLLNAHFLLRLTAHLKAIMILMHSRHELQPTVLAVLLFYFPAARAGMNCICWWRFFFAGSPSQMVENFMKLSCLLQNLFFFNHPFSQQFHCPEIAPYINTNHVCVLHVSQGTKLAVQTQFRTTASLHLLATRLAGCTWYS